MGPLPRTTNGKLYIIVAIDYMTRWVEAQSVAKVNEKTVSKFVYTHICCRFGTPLEIVSDNGPGFRRGLLTEVCEVLKIFHRHNTPYYPQSNGLVEKANGIIAGIIRKMVESKPKCSDNFLDRATWAYRTTYRDATQFTPFHLVYGQESLQPIELNIPTIKLTGRQEQNNDEAWIDRLLNLVELEWKREAAYHCYKKKALQLKDKLNEGIKDKQKKEKSLVLRYNNALDNRFYAKFERRWEGPFIVKKAFTGGYYQLMDLNGKEHPRKVNGYQLKPYLSRILPAVFETKQVSKKTKKFRAALIQQAKYVPKAVKTASSAASSRSTRSRKNFSDEECTDTNKDHNLDESDREDIPKEAEAVGTSKYEKSDEEDTSTPLEKKSQKPRSREQVLMDEAMARVKAGRKELAHARVATAAKTAKPTTMEEARNLRIEKAKVLQKERKRLEVEEKAREEAEAAQAAQTQEKEVIDLSGTVEYLKKLEREKHMAEQWVAQLAREKIKEALSKKTEEPILEPSQGSPKRPRQEEEEEMEHIQADPIPSSPMNIPLAPPSSLITPFPPASTPTTPPSPSTLDPPRSPPTSSSPQQQQPSAEPTVPPSIQEETDQPMDKIEEEKKLTDSDKPKPAVIDIQILLMQLEEPTHEEAFEEAKADLELQKQQSEFLSKGKEAVGSHASTSQIHQAEIHLHIQLPLMPEMPEFSGTEEEEQQRPAPGALDVKE
ncbi:hypothetical protein L7F22_065509 [Adiantum nelumboides]|nr:hypothetical protein [Adiantum nelumboides]